MNKATYACLFPSVFYKTKHRRQVINLIKEHTEANNLIHVSGDREKQKCDNFETRKTQHNINFIESQLQLTFPTKRIVFVTIFDNILKVAGMKKVAMKVIFASTSLVLFSFVQIYFQISEGTHEFLVVLVPFSLHDRQKHLFYFFSSPS